MTETLSGLLARSFEKADDRLALVFDGFSEHNENVSYTQLGDTVKKVKFW